MAKLGIRNQGRGLRKGGRARVFGWVVGWFGNVWRALFFLSFFINPDNGPCFLIFMVRFSLAKGKGLLGAGSEFRERVSNPGSSFVLSVIHFVEEKKSRLSHRRRPRFEELGAEIAFSGLLCLS